MGAKEVKTMEEARRFVFTCDFCGEALGQREFIPRPCCLCGRYFCHAHGTFHDEEGCEYYYCHPCWSLGEPYRERIAKCEEEMEGIRQEWYRKVLIAAGVNPAETPGARGD